MFINNTSPARLIGTKRFWGYLHPTAPQFLTRSRQLEDSDTFASKKTGTRQPGEFLLSGWISQLHSFHPWTLCSPHFRVDGCHYLNKRILEGNGEGTATFMNMRHSLARHMQQATTGTPFCTRPATHARWLRRNQDHYDYGADVEANQRGNQLST